MGEVQRLFEPLAEWQMQRLPRRSEGYTLDWIRQCLNVMASRRVRSKDTTRGNTEGPAIILCWPC